jgi:hypothetical protein
MRSANRPAYLEPLTWLAFIGSLTIVATRTATLDATPFWAQLIAEIAKELAIVDWETAWAALRHFLWLIGSVKRWGGGCSARLGGKGDRRFRLACSFVSHIITAKIGQQIASPISQCGCKIHAT